MGNPFPVSIAQTDLAIVTRSLNKQYGKRAALRDVAIQVPSGSVYLLVGPNGAGKSSTIKILLNLLRPDSGSATILGMNTHDDAPRVRANIGYVPEGNEWGYEWAKVDRMLAHHKAYFPSWDDAYAKQLTDKFRLRLRSKMKSLSKGEARRVHLVAALAHRPPVLVLDEPTDGLDPIMRDETFEVLIDHIADNKTTVLLSTHRIEEVEKLADHIGALNDGVLQGQLPISTLQSNLYRYRAVVPDSWAGVPALESNVVKRTDSPREIEWTIWGEPQEVTERLTATQANVHQVAPLTLLESTMCLLKPLNGGK